MLGQKPNLSKRIREMRASIALQGLARTFYSKPEEEKFNENRELLPQLREAVQEDTRVLGRVRKHELTLSEACAAEQPLGIALARPISVSVSSLSGTFAAAELLSRQGSEQVPASPALPWQRVVRAGPLLPWVPSEPCLQPGKCSHPTQVAQEKLRAEIYGRVNTCNMLLYQVKQRSRAKEQLQRRLQQLQDVRMDEKQHQAQVPGPLAGVAAPVGGFSQACSPGWAPVSAHGLTPCPQPSLPQVVRTLESSIEKTQTKVHAGQKVTALYVAVRDALRKVSSSSLRRALSRSPCKGPEVPKGLCWWDTLLQELLLLPPIFCPSTGHPWDSVGCGSPCPRSWPTCLCTWTC
ncbi:uncharacterized protein LOC136022094 [Lathamus discolor]|uniref:uncharacterized protein LOC136022094 n=1 Tax=Lathamus discolor TaxID=678569 RepID=UPI0032B8156C